MSVPPELRVVCRRLTSAPVDDLPRICPTLVSHVLRCGGALSATPDAKTKDKTSETTLLLHKLRTHITTLLTGRKPSGRFAAICLIKAIIDVVASKELSIITLTKIFILLQGYQTLVREMASPTLPGYITACLQLIKAYASGQPSKAPVSLVDTVAYSLSKILPLYPTTMRPFSAQITTALRTYVAPTSSDLFIVPESLRENARRVLVLLHYTAPKNGNSDEWIKGIRAAIKNSHDTADQIFRAVRESWESTTGYRGQAVSSDGEPSGGGDAADELPAWTSIDAGSERLIGLLDFLASHLKTTTKAPVNLPLGDLLDLTSRISLVTLPSSDDSVDLNPAIGRDEKAELWTVLPDIHTAALRLHLALITRLESNALPLSTDIVDQATRILKSSHHLPTVRSPAYTLLASLLRLSGPSLPKLTVDTLLPLLHACCHDTLPPQPTTTTAAAKPKDPSSSNADAFLTTPPPTNPVSAQAPAAHESAAARLLPLLFSHLPQRHLTPDARALLDRTAVLAASKPALVASVLHPYKDARGRYYPSLLPFLVRRFPRDQEVEVLRTNLVRARGAAVYDASRAWGEDEGEGGDTAMVDEEDEEVGKEEVNTTAAAAGWGEGMMDVDEEKPAHRRRGEECHGGCCPCCYCRG
ncbi:rRNA processing/ribosome biogenesis-domain-containing protein [Schizothecium vesticola]|uniref:Pre-rRNA-processing protein RIX1 n=1 Tax=Schizothecium vesticola TaxID=314040 RepID=A0AA40F8T0_9PEZI|nr:rRNA processing/ribosome biogenesis-domain-containing protein [Schizothecium vesticola]